MPGERVLWTGPYGSATRDHALAVASADPSSLWLSASPMAHDQVRRELAVRSRSDETDRDAGRIPRVWCWADLWARVRDGSREGPSCLSEAAAGAVFGEAIRQARHAGEVDAIAAVIDWPGYRRRLRRRFAEWTTEERPLRSRPPADPRLRGRVGRVRPLPRPPASARRRGRGGIRRLGLQATVAEAAGHALGVRPGHVPRLGGADAGPMEGARPRPAPRGIGPRHVGVRGWREFGLDLRGHLAGPRPVAAARVRRDRRSGPRSGGRRDCGSSSRPCSAARRPARP